MKFRDIFLTASANMFRSKLRTGLTITAIFIGALTLTVTNGLSAGISSYIDKQVNNLGQGDVISITAKNTTSSSGAGNPQKYEPGKVSGRGSGPDAGGILLTQSDIDILKTDQDLTDIKPAYVLNPDYIQGVNGDKYVVSLSPLGGNNKLDLAAGRQIASDASDNQVVLPISYVAALGFNDAASAVGKSVTIAVSDATGEQHTVTATVAGVQQKGIVSLSGAVAGSALEVNLYNLQTIGLPAASKNRYQSASARMVGGTGDARLKEIKDRLDKLGFTGTTTADRLGAFKTVINAITLVLNAFAIIALLAASFGIVNTLLMSVQERTKEIGLMKAMGMRSYRIFLLFSIEAVLIGFWGSAVGVAVAMAVGFGANHIAANGILKDLPGFDLLLFPWQSIAGIFLLIMAVAFVAGTLPAWRAARQNPITALRYE
jgi:putative ABC transport system permease protein